MQKPAYALKKIDFKQMHSTEKALAGLGLHTVCHQARCPNISECFGRGTATFLILGDVCTRKCSFCNVAKGKPQEADQGEPEKVAEAAERLKLKYVVITSVTRDDLKDGGASVYAEAISRIKKLAGKPKVEVLVPDFQGDVEAIRAVLAAEPDVFAHNVETVPSLYHVRPGAVYQRSLGVLRKAKYEFPGISTKSAVMLGLGEKQEEVLGVFTDLIKAGCDYISIGQYLQPDKDHFPVSEYIKPETFEWYKEQALGAGFKWAESGVWVRSSYKAENYKF
jgi:lipoic acid synthetase